ncbi:MAG: response regulator [Planctomycetes bacterium]|nr:response regulator [Planctomycetota bacterium]MBM4085071.1 response regulator [Planctomycetota bacterium]
MAKAPKTIMLVDDDADVVEAMRLVLESNGYKVEAAYNGDECLAKVKSVKPNLIVLDVMMTKETEGFHVAYALRKDASTAKTPILMLTGIGERTGMKFSPKEDEDYLPVDEFAEKPLAPEELLKRVKKLLKE